MMILPELSTLLFSIVFLFLSLGKKRDSAVLIAKSLSIIIFGISLTGVVSEGQLFSGAYRLDLFSQVLKAVIAYGFCLVIFMLDRQNEIEEAYFPEYIMFLGFSTLGLMMLVYLYYCGANDIVSPFSENSGGLAIIPN